MGEYIIRRLISMHPVLLFVSVISFDLLYVLPGDPAIARLENYQVVSGYAVIWDSLREGERWISEERPDTVCDPTACFSGGVSREEEDRE